MLKLYRHACLPIVCVCVCVCVIERLACITHYSKT